MELLTKIIQGAKNYFAGAGDQREAGEDSLDREKFLIEVSKLNRSRVRLVFSATFVIHIPLIAIDIYRYYKGIWDVNFAYREMFYLHLFLMTFLVFCLVFERLIEHNKVGKSFFVFRFGEIALFLLLFWFVLLSMVDQRLNGQITAYIIGVIGYSAILITPPSIRIFSLAFNGIVFLVLISWFQPNPDILVSHYINGSSITVVGMLLSYSFYNNYIKNYLKSDMIRTKTTLLNKTLEKIYSDLRFSRDIHCKLMPSDPLPDKRVEQYTGYFPATHVGGDFYDYFMLNEDKLMLFIADVAGHGASAALSAMAIKTEFELLKDEPLSPDQLLRNLNDNYIEKYTRAAMLYTAQYASIDLRTRKIEYGTGGHPPPVVIKTDGQLRELPMRGKLFGIEKGVKPGCFTEQLDPGDTICFYTDGIFEQFNSIGEIYGEERFYNSLSDVVGVETAQAGEKILKTLRTFIGAHPLNDDITLILVRVA